MLECRGNGRGEAVVDGGTVTGKAGEDEETVVLIRFGHSLMAV